MVAFGLTAALLLGVSQDVQAYVMGAPERRGPGCAEQPTYVTLQGRRILELRATAGAYNLKDAADQASRELLRIARDHSIAPEAIAIREGEGEVILEMRQDGEPERTLGFINQRVAACYGMNRVELAEQTRDSLRAAIRRYRDENTLASWLRALALAGLLVGVYVLWLRLQGQINRWTEQWIARRRLRVLDFLNRHGVGHFIAPEQVRYLLQMSRKVVHWSVLILISYLLIPLLLGLFPPTQSAARELRQQLVGLLAGVARGVVASIPDVVSLSLILLVTTVAIKASNAWFRALERGSVRIPGFYQEWAPPTSRLAALLLAAAGLATAFPYIPGSDSRLFQGAGLLLGVLAALGSSAIATNIMSGLMLIYTRAFREGDLVDINGVMGVVQDRALLVTRLQTPRNELVSIPNATVIGTSVVNYSFSRREIRKPVALSTTITIGYEVPWRTVYRLMLKAAYSVAGISRDDKPYVLQTSLNDFHISYELTAYVREPGSYRQTLSRVLEALQDEFAAAGIEILSPGYHAIRNGNPRTIPAGSE
ncbi:MULTISPECIES: mechanosensitive ion channel family protein [Aphanothece]|uniref:mechanosensitive ion channel family protein n=1 Tax=Aphanothece TaxID=1121 RepID=UPI0039853B1B